MKQRIAVAMSGGVDSSVAAAILQEQGYDVIGLTARMWAEGSRCCSEEDIRSARQMADFLGFPHHVVDLHEEFGRRVVEYFVAEYVAGRTPSPCAVCNRYVKFGSLLDAAVSLGAERMATGHYAQIRPDDNGILHLFKGADSRKDQSYFLFDLSQDQLARSAFPLGAMAKQDAIKYAHDRKLPVANRGESQDLCFVDPMHYYWLIERLRPQVRKEGDIVDSNGNKLGKHEGIHRYTVGQRRGIGVAVGRPLYVLSLDPAANRVVLGEKELLMKKKAIINNVRWIIGNLPPKPIRATTRIRYNHRGADSLVTPTDSNSAVVEFDEPQSAITPGQVAAFYIGDELIGGGWISDQISM